MIDPYDDPTLVALVAAIRLHPDDHTPVLMYADRLRELAEEYEPKDILLAQAAYINVCYGISKCSYDSATDRLVKCYIETGLTHLYDVWGLRDGFVTACQVGNLDTFIVFGVDKVTLKAEAGAFLKQNPFLTKIHAQSAYLSTPYVSAYLRDAYPLTAGLIHASTAIRQCGWLRSLEVADE